MAICLGMIHCTDDATLDIMERDINYVDPQQDHRVAFSISSSGQTVSYSATQGEDSDYLGNMPAMSFIDNADGTITDTITGLIWTKCSMKSDGVIDSTPGCSEVHGQYTWQNAMSACNNLDLAGKTDWRLPRYPELFSIINFGQEGVGKAAVDPLFFPNTEYTDIYHQGGAPWTMESTRIWIAWGVGTLKYYWTSSLWSDDGYAHIINFDDGHSNLDDYSGLQYVRCVRK